MIRTVNCKHCGEVEMLIEPMFEQIVYKCSNCESTVATATAKERYVAPNNQCAECNKHKFKVKMVEEYGEQEWDVKCISCDAPIQWYYSDENLNKIEAGPRRELLLKDYIDELEVENEELREQLSVLQYTIENSNNKKFSILSFNKDTERQVREKQEEIDRLMLRNESLIKRVEELESEIKGLNI